MKRYWFILGLCLSLIGAVWLIVIVRSPLPSDRVDAYFSARGRRGEATIAFCVFFLGVGLILADTFMRNPQAERVEKKKEALREGILSLLPFSKQTQQELNIYIEQVYGRTGLIGLEVEQLEEVKRHVERQAAERMQSS